MRVGIIDTGLRSAEQHGLKAGRAFILASDMVIDLPIGEDHLGHGTLVTRLVQEQAPGVEVLMAQVFDRRAVTTAAQLTAALSWLLEQDVALINCSLGLHADRPALHDACRQAAAQGVIMCASSPAIGQMVYPAGYAEVVGVTGDARCLPGEWSWLQGVADFGAAVGPQSAGGASMACARFSGLLAAFWSANPELDAAQVLAYFRKHACRTGPQRREPLCVSSE